MRVLSVLVALLATSEVFASECGFAACTVYDSRFKIEEPATPTSLAGTPLPLGSDFVLPENHTAARFSSISDRTSYSSTCANAALDFEAFMSFRSDEIYHMILGGLSGEVGQLYLDRILLLDAGLLDCLPQFKTLDLIGNPPNVVNYGAAYGFMTPLTLRYVHGLLELVRTIGDLSGKHIIEIGGGFGGQFKIISDIFTVGSYTIVDIPEALALTSKVLDYFPRAKRRSVLVAPSAADVSGGIAGGSLDDPGFMLEEYDLCYSVYAFTELDYPSRVRYWEMVFARCKKGFVLDNSRCQYDEDVVEGNQRLGMEKVAELLRAKGLTVDFELEEPQTGCTNEIVTWF